MAQKRCIPTDLFFTPAFAELSSDTVRLILIGLVTDADDAGRGLADKKLLGRKLDHPPEQIASALDELTQAGYVICYGSGKGHYYALCHWKRWQTLSKPVPSQFPAPPTIIDGGSQDSPEFPKIPQGNSGACGGSQDSPEFPQIPQGNLGECGEIPSEDEGKRREEEERREGEGEEELPSNVVTFPVTAQVHDTTTTTTALSLSEVKHVTTQVARILTLTVTEALTRVVADYASDPALSLLGEADAAHEYIEDPRRNRQKQRMTPAFFRRWLKREHEDTLRRRHPVPSAGQGHQATGTDGAVGRVVSAHAPPETTDPYHAFVTRRAQETQGTPETPKGDGHGTHQ